MAGKVPYMQDQVGDNMMMSKLAQGNLIVGQLSQPPPGYSLAHSLSSLSHPQHVLPHIGHLPPHHNSLHQAVNILSHPAPCSPSPPPSTGPGTPPLCSPPLPTGYSTRN